MAKPHIFLQPIAPMAPREVRELGRSETWSLDELQHAFPGWNGRRRLTRAERAAKRGLRRRQAT